MKYKVISKDRYHLYALGEVITRTSNAYNFILDGYEYKNGRGIIQYLPDSHVEQINA